MELLFFNRLQTELQVISIDRILFLVLIDMSKMSIYVTTKMNLQLNPDKCFLKIISLYKVIKLSIVNIVLIQSITDFLIKDINTLERIGTVCFLFGLFLTWIKSQNWQILRLSPELQRKGCLPFTEGKTINDISSRIWGQWFICNSYQYIWKVNRSNTEVS